MEIKANWSSKDENQNIFKKNFFKIVSIKQLYFLMSNEDFELTNLLTQFFLQRLAYL